MPTGHHHDQKRGKSMPRGHIQDTGWGDAPERDRGDAPGLAPGRGDGPLDAPPYRPGTRNGPPWPGMTMSAAARIRARDTSMAAWSSPSGSMAGVMSWCHHAWVMA